MGGCGVKTAPDWFHSAVGQTPRHETVVVDGLSIHLRRWGEPEAPGIVLIHGGAANAAWWDHLAPLLVGHQVVAVDLSGHGLSEWRPHYTLRSWGEEVIAVIRQTGFPGPPLVVGHSMGGLVAYEMARDHGDELAGVVIVDAPFPDEEEAQRLRDSPRARPRNVYDERESIIERFRLLPAADVREPYLLAHIAEESVIQTDEGWSWRFDPLFFDHDWTTMRELSPVTGCAIAIVRGEHGLLAAADAEVVATAVGSASSAITIADSGHHVPVDQPIAMSVLIASFAHAWIPARAA